MSADVQAYLDKIPNGNRPVEEVPLLTYTAYCAKNSIRDIGQGWIEANWVALRDDVCRVINTARIHKDWIISIQDVGVCPTESNQSNSVIAMCIHKGHS
jgi:hypothetical protein